MQRLASKTRPRSLLALGLVLLLAGAARAENIFLTGHDVLLHDGQNGFDTVVLDYLRCAGTPDEIPAAGYSIAVLGSGVGSWGWSDVPGFNDQGAKPGYAGTTYYDTDDLISSAINWSTVLSHDCLVILSHSSCGGCDLDSAGVAEINANSGAITAAFNAGLDLWVMSGANEPAYYNFLPPAFATSGPPISGSSGFVATVDGANIGLTSAMINGFPTHNRFTGFSTSVVPMEVRPDSTGFEEVISLGGKGIQLGCLEVTEEMILCDPDVPGKFNYTLTITNNSGVDAQHVKFIPKDEDGDGVPDATMDPDTVTMSIPDGASVTVNTCFFGAFEGQTVCFEIWLMDADLEQCCVQCHCATMPDCCLEIVEQLIECDPDVPGTFHYHFNLQNNAPYDIDRVFLWPIGGFTMTPDEFIVGPVSTGGTTGGLHVNISGANPGDTICFQVSIHNSQTGECCSGQTVCLTLPECDPCDVDVCHIPPITALCQVPGTDFVEGTINLRICNACEDEPAEFEWHLDPITNSDCPTPWLTTANYNPSSGIVPGLDPGDCVDITIQVSSDWGQFPPGECACFEVHILNLTTGTIDTCVGKLRSPDPVTAKPFDDTPTGVEVGVPGTGGFTFTDTTGGPGFEVELITQSSGASLSINGGAPGQSVFLTTPAGGGDITFEVSMADHEPFVFYDIILMVDPQGEGTPQAIASQTFFSLPSTDCNGNGIPDDEDISSGTSEDVDGDGVPDECQGSSTGVAGQPFLRGDANGDGHFDVGDPVGLLFHVFNGQTLDGCPKAADANDDGGLDVGDGVAMLTTLFGGGVLPEPYPACGGDPTSDTLTCTVEETCH